MLINNFTVAPNDGFPSDKNRTVQFYPNPATTVIYFEFPVNFNKSNYSLHLYNFLGRKMNEFQVTGNKITVQLDNYLRGLYVFQIRDKAGSIIESGKFQVIK